MVIRLPEFFKCLLLAMIWLTGPQTLQAKTVYDTLYINPGNFKAIDGTEVTGLVFNHTDTFGLAPAVLHFSEADELLLTVINNDPKAHTLKIEDENTILGQISVATHDTNSFSLIRTNEPKIYNLVSAKDEYRYAGLGSMLVFDDTLHTKPFYWNVRDLDVEWLEAYETLNLSDSIHYHPEYFTINNVSFPQTLEDPKGYVNARLHDTIRIYLHNAGIMDHNIHFHGYHVTILYSSIHSHYVGWEKDSFPLKTGESMIVEFIPKQTDQFPAHNHNLGATLGNNIYPNGMVTWINITE